jgi:hypothetical protein
MHATKEAGPTNYSSTDKESVTMTKLHEHQVGRWAAREEHFSGSQRRIVNQHRTGVVGRFTLRDILKRRSNTYGLNSSMCIEEDLSTYHNTREYWVNAHVLE